MPDVFMPKMIPGLHNLPTCLPLCLGLLLALSQPTLAATQNCLAGLLNEQARLDRVSDGDTLVLTDGRRVRLLGINTAEINNPDARLNQAADMAKNALASLLAPNDALTLFVETEQYDRYGRLLAHAVRTEDKLAVAPSLLEQGLAVQVAVSPNTRCAEDFAKLEQSARAKQIGAWDKLAAFTIDAKNLSGNERGFHLVTGKVSRIKVHKRYTEIYLNDALRLLIRPKLASAMQVGTLQNKTIEVRGWLNNRKNQVFLWLQHHTNLRVLDN